MKRLAVDCSGNTEPVLEDLDADELAEREQLAEQLRQARDVDELREGNAGELRRRLDRRIADLADAAKLVAAGNATAAQQRDAIALALLSCARLARLAADRLDAVD